ncbi:MAG: hypothetical protein ABSD74_19285 [Rhizomicrobium sp.]|jgi:hypothetical protein
MHEPRNEGLGSAAPQRAKRWNVLTRVYYIVRTAFRHVGGVFGAFALAAFFAHFINLDWHGALGQFFGAWNAVVRPVTKHLLDLTVVPVWLWLFGWQPHIPLIVRDYLSTGVVLLLSIFRLSDVWGEFLGYFEFPLVGKSILFKILFISPWCLFWILVHVLIVVLVVFFWPFMTLRTVAKIIFPSIGEQDKISLLKLLRDKFQPDVEITDDEIAEIIASHRRDRQWNDVQSLLPFLYLLAAEIYNIAVGHGFLLTNYLKSYH